MKKAGALSPAFFISPPRRKTLFHAAGLGCSVTYAVFHLQKTPRGIL